PSGVAPAGRPTREPGSRTTGCPTESSRRWPGPYPTERSAPSPPSRACTGATAENPGGRSRRERRACCRPRATTSADSSPPLPRTRQAVGPAGPSPRTTESSVGAGDSRQESTRRSSLLRHSSTCHLLLKRGHPLRELLQIRIDGRSEEHTSELQS